VCSNAGLTDDILHFCLTMFLVEPCPCVCSNAGLTDDILHSVLERGGRNISSLDLSCNPKLITDFGISIIGMYCSNLERLDLSEMYLTQTAMKKLSQKCPELKWLRVCGAHTVGENW
jgi:hypothetical protein